MLKSNFFNYPKNLIIRFKFFSNIVIVYLYLINSMIYLDDFISTFLTIMSYVVHYVHNLAGIGR